MRAWDLRLVDQKVPCFKWNDIFDWSSQIKIVHHYFCVIISSILLILSSNTNCKLSSSCSVAVPDLQWWARRGLCQPAFAAEPRPVHCLWCGHLPVCGSQAVHAHLCSGGGYHVLCPGRVPHPAWHQQWLCLWGTLIEMWKSGCPGWKLLKGLCCAVPCREISGWLVHSCSM